MHPDAGWSSLVARRAHNPKVVGSNPAPATTLQLSAICCPRQYEQRLTNAILAQLVERNLAKVEVIGSNPMYRSKFYLTLYAEDENGLVSLYLTLMKRKEKHPDAGWSSLVARRAHNPKVVGSNPAPATTLQLHVVHCLSVSA